MPLSYILSNLLADVEKAEAVIFLDAEGEAIETLSSRLQPYDVKVQGAYQVVHYNQLSRQHPGLGRFFYVGDHFSVFTTKVGPEYFLVVITAGDILPGRVIRHLDRARKDIEEKVL
jgi:hypothetical protein